MTGEEFVEWLGYDSIQPWGERRADIRSAIVAVTIYNQLRAADAPARSVEDFLPQFRPPGSGAVQAPPPADLGERIIAALMAAAPASGG